MFTSTPYWGSVHHVGKPLEVLKGNFQNSGQDMMRKASKTLAKGLEASYAVSLLIAKAKKLFSIGEDLLLPAAVVLAVLWDHACWTKTQQRNERLCLCQMSSDSFSLQLDESTDVSGNSQLVAFVRYVDTDDIYEHIVFCKTLEGKTKGENVFYVIITFCENGLSWKSCRIE